MKSAGSLLTQRMARRLSELKARTHFRELRPVEGLNLCSNDYLGLATNARLKAALIQGIEECSRVGATGSRLLSGHDVVWDLLEEEFASFAGTEAALFFTSGFGANLSLFPALLGPDDLVFSDALNHASIIDGIRLSRAQKIVYPHCDLNILEENLRLHSGGSAARVIVTESIFSMNGDRAPLAEIFRLAQQFGAEVIVDEAHATGVCGPKGRGLVANLGLEKQALAVVHMCGKALASMGAFVCGSRILTSTLINHGRSLIFSTALPPYFALQVQAALRLAAGMDFERQHLGVLGDHLRARLNALGCDCGPGNSHIVPWIVGNNQAAMHVSSALEQRGYSVRAIRSPSVPPGTERLRISLNASLTMQDIAGFADAASSVLTIGAAHV
jgi:8-amino-7-oxononanoate synthase